MNNPKPKKKIGFTFTMLAGLFTLIYMFLIVFTGLGLKDLVGLFAISFFGLSLIDIDIILKSEKK